MKIETTIIDCCIYNRSLDAILKSIIKRQIPFLIGGTITGNYDLLLWFFIYYYSKQWNLVCNFLFS